MPWNWVEGPTGTTGTRPMLYFLPPGLTGVGTVGQVVAFLLDSYGFPTSDPGITGAVWNNLQRAAVSTGATGP